MKRSNASALIQIEIDIPAKTPWGTKRPFSKFKAPLREPLELGRDCQRNGSDRQILFQHTLTDMAACRGSNQIPWHFRTLAGEALQLDRGAIGHAKANGFLRWVAQGPFETWYVELASDAVADAALFEVQRMRRLGAVAIRTKQKEFSELIRTNYENRCAVTGCAVAAALEAAHIHVIDGKDDNSPDNGILLRSDIHALLDAHLISITEDGSGVEASQIVLRDPCYKFLKGAKVRSPSRGPRPSRTNIAYHRRKFIKLRGL